MVRAAGDGAEFASGVAARRRAHLYSLAPERHQRISFAVALGLVFLGLRFWYGWAFWGIVLLVLALRLKHPPLYDRWER